MTIYAAEKWKDFFVAAAGASAALAGLVIVAMSVNINQILKFRQLPARAAATIGSLVPILIASMAGLVHQGTSTFGAELLLFGACAWVMQMRSHRQAFAVGKEFQRPQWDSLLETFVGQLQTLPFIVAGFFAQQERERSLLACGRRDRHLCIFDHERMGAAGGDSAMKPRVKMANSW